MGDGAGVNERALSVRSLAMPISVRGEAGNEARAKRALRRSGC